VDFFNEILGNEAYTIVLYRKNAKYFLRFFSDFSQRFKGRKNTKNAIFDRFFDLYKFLKNTSAPLKSSYLGSYESLFIEVSYVSVSSFYIICVSFKFLTHLV
jgi:hypothetical protein